MTGKYDTLFRNNAFSRASELQANPRNQVKFFWGSIVSKLMSKQKKTHYECCATDATSEEAHQQKSTTAKKV